MSGSAEYKVSLDVYSGPLDLLLFLIRRDEIDIYDIPIARILEQYLGYVDVLGEIDPDVISEFLLLAATLMEIKSRLLLPRPPVEEAEAEFIDPRLELVHQLLEYKKFKDAARSLEDSADVRSHRFARAPTAAESPSDEIELDNLDIWTLYEAFNKLLTEIGKTGGVHTVGVDDTPVALHAEDILDSIERSGGTQAFEQVFTGRSRPEMIGLFLALLELIRQRRVRVLQDRPFGLIQVTLLDRRPLDQVDELGNRMSSPDDEVRSDVALPKEAPIAEEAFEDDASDAEELILAERTIERTAIALERMTKSADSSREGPLEQAESPQPTGRRNAPDETE